MKVTTKVATGAGLLVGLLLVALARDVALVRSLASAHRMLSEERFSAVTSTLEILRTVELVEERLLKFFVTRDGAYREQLERQGTEIAALLDRQAALKIPEEERAAVERLASRWADYRAQFADSHEAIVTAKPAERDELRTELTARVDEVRSAALSLLAVLRLGIERDVESAQEQARRGESISRIFAAAAVVWGVLFVVITFRSLNGPLARLIAATRTVGAGPSTRLELRGRDELAELARAFDAMVERLDEVDRMKRDFIWRISHELKTPLAAMQETTQLMADELAGPLTDKQRRMLSLNLEAGRRLSTMLSRLLDVARLEAGAVAYDVRPLDLSALVGTALQEFEARLAEKKLVATFEAPESPVMTFADRDWLVQVFENLLENAVKFSPPERRLWLRLESYENEEAGRAPVKARALVEAGRCAVVSVEDEGPGIPDEARERLFEKFFQVERRRRAGQGVGLGLAICKDIVAAHGGLVWVDPREGGGCAFRVALPLPTREEALELQSKEGVAGAVVSADGGAPGVVHDEPAAG